jgi:hypothetical protein
MPAGSPEVSAITGGRELTQAYRSSSRTSI